MPPKLPGRSTTVAKSQSRASAGRPVLLVPGTGTIPGVDYGWNYERAFTAKGIAWCALTLPESANGDIQVAGEYIVSAIHTMASASGQKIDVFGWSQGGWFRAGRCASGPIRVCSSPNALVIDALRHTGRGAAAVRIQVAVCRQRYQPGVEPATFDRNFAAEPRGQLILRPPDHHFDEIVDAQKPIGR